VRRILRSRFLWELYAGYAVVILAIVLLVGGIVLRDSERGFVDHTRELLHSDALLLRDIALPFVENGGDSLRGAPQLQNRIRALGARTDTRYTVIAADGRVLADSREEPAVMDNHRDRPEVMAAARDGIGVSTRFSRTLNTTLMYLAIPVISNGRVTGYVRTAVGMDELDHRREALRRRLVAAMILPVLAALVFGLLLARSFTGPLLSMTDAARAVAAGEYERHVRIDRRDEIGALADALNSMTTQLRSQIDTILADRNKTLSILAGMVEGLVAVDRDERVVHVNAAAQAILGIDAKGAPGRRIWEATRVAEVSEALSDAMRQNRVRVSEVRLPTPQKDQVIQLTAAPLKDANDRLDGAIVVLHDVSELRQLESVRRDFVANISHELKTPLAAIRGLVETLIDDREMETPTRERFIEKIRDQSLRLSSIVSDLLTLSRLESGAAGLRFESMDLRDTITESYRAQVHAAETKQVQMVAQLPDVPVAINGDGEALRELVDNLVNNAIKYTPTGGRVDVRLGVEGSSVVLEVEDTGIGIPIEEQGRVFERFYRVDKARSRQLGGTGLGLSIVKHVALAHGGNVSLKSAPGRGSTFRVQLALKRGNGNGSSAG
jgi:two-component system phosphate regulon sensor histidine kinase PhoR